jgi:hypothetical protein
MQNVEPWMSDHDIRVGTVWDAELTARLSEADVGIICLTPENLEEPWLLFEASAWSRSVKSDPTLVCTYLWEMKSTDVRPPLQRFQWATADQEGTRRLLTTMNLGREESRFSDEALNQIFSAWWPTLKSSLESIPPAPKGTKAQRSEREILNEILQWCRASGKTTQDLDTNLNSLGHAVYQHYGLGLFPNPLTSLYRTTLASLGGFPNPAPGLSIEDLVQKIRVRPTATESKAAEPAQTQPTRRRRPRQSRPRPKPKDNN